MAMLAKQLAIGSTPASLVAYLYGPGRSNEHTDQRMLAGSPQLLAMANVLNLAEDAEARSAVAREFDGAWRQVRREKGLPLTPAEDEALRGVARADRVFHATLSLGPKDGALSDEQWAQAARDFVREMGFIDSPQGADCAWMAINHGDSKGGNDHIHIAVNLVREDGTRADINRSKLRTARAGARIAASLGLEAAFEDGVYSGVGNISRAELERAQREKRDADRLVVRRRLAGAAWHARSEAEYVRAARAAGVILLPRYAEGGLVKVTGYKAALADAGAAIWFSPSKHLDKNLSLPALRAAKGWTFEDQMDAVSVWRESARSKQGAGALRLPVEDEIKRVRVTLTREHSEIRWRRVAADASNLLGAWAVEVNGAHSGHLAKASDALAKAAQPRRSSARESLAEVATTLGTATAAASKNDTVAQLAVLMQLMRLAEAVASSAAADREARQARELYERAVVPLNIQAGLIRYQRDEQHLATVDPELAEVMRVTGAVRPGPAREQIDYTILSPETVQVLRSQNPPAPAPRATAASRPHRARQTPARRDEGYER
ncbi:relaxase/mobilization nuclease domain-containing protein [Brachybacterium sp. UNK5269]|uniref:relaxase/mobilization nuclease domain-containing protein n=1 Tax=Brachybacterium sp. UNK5269 TaxID=3408576 RepID=UPI003BAF81D4